MCPISRKITLTEVVENDEPLAFSDRGQATAAGIKRVSGMNKLLGRLLPKLNPLHLPFSIRSFFAFSRIYRWWIISMLFVVAGWFVLRNDAPALDPTEEKLALMETRLGRLEKELSVLKLSSRKDAVGTAVRSAHTPLASAPPGNGSLENQIVTQRRFVPDGSEKDDPFYGQKDSPLLIMVFSDYQCRNCQNFHRAVIPQLKKEFADVGLAKVMLRDFPLTGNDAGKKAAILAHCAGEQDAYWQVFELLSQDEKASTTGNFSRILGKLKKLDQAALAQCLRSKRYSSELAADQAAGTALGVKGAPSTFIGVRQTDGSYSGELIRGAQPIEYLRQQIALISQAGTPNANVGETGFSP